jgi:transposase
VRIHRLGLARFESAVRREILRAGRQKPRLRIVRALSNPAGVIAHRCGALERVALLLAIGGRPDPDSSTPKPG